MTRWHINYTFEKPSVSLSEQIESRTRKCSLELVPPRASRCFVRFFFARKLQWLSSTQVIYTYARRKAFSIYDHKGAPEGAFWSPLFRQKSWHFSFPVLTIGKKKTSFTPARLLYSEAHRDGKARSTVRRVIRGRSQHFSIEAALRCPYREFPFISVITFKTFVNFVVEGGG